MGAPEMYPDLYREHLTGDPAYDKAFAALADCPSFVQVEQALKTYAHELAEKQRAFRGPSMTMAGRTMVPLEMITDLIDPEVSE
jgi:hypothetical protein